MTRFHGSFALVAALPLCASLSCSDATLPVTEPPPRPPVAPADPPGEQALRPAPPRDIGTFGEAAPPRSGVAAFQFPRGAPQGPAPYSPELTAAIVNRLELNRWSADAIPMDAAIEGDISKAAADLAARPEAKKVDVFIAGTLLPGGNAQARFFAFDPARGRSIAKSEFEGSESQAVIARALEDIHREVHRYWFELQRGDLAEVAVEVRGLADATAAGALHEALARVPGVQVARHDATAVEAGSSIVWYRLYYRGDPAELAGRLAEVRWRSGESTHRLERGNGFQFQAVRE